MHSDRGVSRFYQRDCFPDIHLLSPSSCFFLLSHAESLPLILLFSFSRYLNRFILRLLLSLFFLFLPPSFLRYISNSASILIFPSSSGSSSLSFYLSNIQCKSSLFFLPLFICPFVILSFRTILSYLSVQLGNGPERALHKLIYELLYDQEFHKWSLPIN